SDVTPPSTMNGLLAVWGSGPHDIWAAGQVPTLGLGEMPTVFHYDGMSWTPFSITSICCSSGSFAFSSIWGTGPRDVWLGTQAGELFHYDGTSWQQDFSAYSLFSYSIDSIWGSGDKDIWFGGNLFSGDGSTAIAHYDGHIWTAVEIPNSARSIWGTGT